MNMPSPLRRLAPWTKPITRAAKGLQYRRRLASGQAAGSYQYAFLGPTTQSELRLEVLLNADTDPQRAQAFCARQTLAELAVSGYDQHGEERWRVNAQGALPIGQAPAPWFFAPGDLDEAWVDDLYAAYLESALMVAASEAVDAVALNERLAPQPVQTGHSDTEPAPQPTQEVTELDQLHQGWWRRRTLFSAGAYAYNPAADRVVARQAQRLGKLIEREGVGPEERSGRTFHRHRRGPYLSSEALGPMLDVGIYDPRGLPRLQREDARPKVLIMAPFLARGGAEHTLYETLWALRNQFAFALVTVAPHRKELGDRREDFAQLCEQLYCLGDLVHPAAMPGMLSSLMDSLGTEVLYNANGSTLFYDFAPGLKAERPELRILDHLYDHKVGYIDRYSPDLLGAVDCCVAENRRIAEVLEQEHGWPRERSPVIWPCGRRREEFPSAAESAELRAELRKELRIPKESLLILTAARMHAQKRPTDLVRLAQRLGDRRDLYFLLVGGGPLENEVDEAIAQHPGLPLRRLPFRRDIPRLIVAADVGCLVSDYEGLPVFMLECLQAGRPFLGTDVGEMGQVLRETEAGLVVAQPGDLDDLERQVRRLTDATLWAELAEKALAAGSRFDPAHCAARYGAAFLGQDLSPEG